MEKFITNNVSETVEVGKKFALRLKQGDFIALYGDLGAGKTAFVSGIANELIPDAYVHSPTYALVNEYEGNDIKICHFDMYRIQDEDDLYSIGFYDYIYIGNDIIIVEWCEKIPYALPDEYYKVTIEKTEENIDTRNITIEKVYK
jgi:ATPase, YjeE family